MTDPTTMTVMFRPECMAPAQGFSPSAAKPAQVVAAWQEAGLPLRVIAPRPATVDDLARAHDRGYVEDVLALRRANGFGTRDERVAASLPFTSGAMLDGARVAVAERTAVCAPMSGFHHAGWSRGGGFCTFNGLMVAALAMQAAGLVERVAIVDCDAHYGDGTDDILERLGNPAWVRHYTAGATLHSRTQSRRFFGELDEALAGFAEVDLVLYQAGADPHIDDPLGGLLTTDEMAERDRRVFAAAAQAKVPLVWCLAGGYQVDPEGSIGAVIALHSNTAREHLRAFGGR
jgi:acetoin utilization deacetylase AcuC-like enzyme